MGRLMANETTQRRVLRIGIINAGRIVEERLLKRREDVSIGPSSRNTLIVPTPTARYGKSHTLFELRAGGYQLVYDREMEGRVSLGDDEIVDLQAVAKAGRATKRGSFYVLPLPDRGRGKVVLGEYTILFQFVDPPAAATRPRLPASTRGGLTTHVDWTFTYILLLCAMLIGGGGVGSDVWWRIRGRYEVEQYGQRKSRAYEVLKAEVLRLKETPEEEPEKQDADKKPEEVPLTDDKPDEGEEAKSEEDQPAERKRVTSTKSERKSRTKKQIAASVRKKTFLHVLGSEGGGAGSIANTLKDGVSDAKLADAFKMDGGVDFAKAGQRPGAFVGSPKAVEGDGEAYKSLSGGDTAKRIATKAVATTKKDADTEKRIKVRVGGGTLGGMSGTGKIDKGSVARVFQRRKGAIKYCYEKALKTNPKVSGKVSIRFQIGTAGRITNVTVTANTTGDSSIGACISGKVQSWRFPPAEGGAVTFTHTFILSSS
jgi:outer membrane biosynthesis protein TonB